MGLKDVVFIISPIMTTTMGCPGDNPCAYGNGGGNGSANPFCAPCGPDPDPPVIKGC